MVQFPEQPSNLYEAPPVASVARDTSFAQSVYNANQYWVDPLIGMFSYNDGADREEFDRSVPVEHLDIAPDLLMSSTKKEFDTLIWLNERRNSRRKSMAQQSGLQTFGAELFNPTTYVDLIGLKGAGGFLSSVSRVAGSTALTEGSIQALRYSQMPGYSAKEAAMNTAVAATVGGLFGGAAYGAKLAFGNLSKNVHRAYGQHSDDILEAEALIKLNDQAIRSERSKRMFGHLSDTQLDARIDAARDKLFGTENYINQLTKQNGSPDHIANLNRIADDLYLERTLLIEERAQRKFDAGISVVKDPWGIVSTLYDKIDPLPTPMKSVLRVAVPENASDNLVKAINVAKKTALLMANDGSLLLNGQRKGLTLPPSVEVMGMNRKAQVYTLEQNLTKVWAEATDAGGIGSNFMRGVTRQENTLDNWLNEVNRKRIRQEPLSQHEASAAQIIDNFFESIRREATDADVMGSQAFVEKQVIKTTQKYEDYVSKFDALNERLRKGQSVNQREMLYVKNRLEALRNRLTELEASLDFVTQNKIRPAGPKEPYFTRQWNVDAIAKDEAGPKEFRRILTEYIRANPEAGMEYDAATALFKPKTLITEESQEKYVSSVIDAILSDFDPSQVVTSRSNRFPSRNVQIPNSLVLDFINNDVRDVLRSYAIRSGSKIDFSKQFGGRSFDEVADDVVDSLTDSGMSINEALKIRNNLRALYDRVTMQTITDPTTLTAKSVQFLKDYASINYLQSAGPTAFGDSAKIVFEHGFKNVFKGIHAVIESKPFRKALADVKGVVGEGLEVSLATAQQKLVEESGATIGKTWTNIKSYSFILNGLGPITSGMKMFTGALGQHNFLDTMGRIVDGSASRFDLDFMARHNPSVVQIKEILSKAKIEETGSGLKVSDVTTWIDSGISSETVAAYKAAIAMNINNNILSSSAATRFKYADGYVLAPIDVARKFFPNIEEHPKNPGYARWENPIMTMPFTFYNWTMSASTNILHSAAQGQLKHRFAGAFTALTFGYLLAYSRTPEWVWDEMDTDQKFMAALDRSGLSAVYGAVATKALQVSAQTGLNNPENDMLRLPFYGNEGMAEAFTNIGGAGFGVMKDAFDIGALVADGEYSDAFKDFYFSLPMTKLFWLREESDAFQDMINESITGGNK